MNQFIISQPDQHSGQTQEELEDLAIEFVLGPQKIDRVRAAGVGASTSRSKKTIIGGTPLQFKDHIQMHAKIDNLEEKNNYLESCLQMVFSKVGLQFPHSAQDQVSYLIYNIMSLFFCISTI